MNLERVQTKPYVNIFLTLVLATAFILLVSNTANVLYEQFLAEPKFDSQVKIGPISVEGLTRSEAEQKVAAEVRAWQSKLAIDLVWNEKKRPLSSSVIVFDILGSIQQAHFTGTSPLLFDVVDEPLDAAVSELLEQNTEGSLDRPALQQRIQQLVSALPTESVSLNLIDYIKDQPSTVTTVSQVILSNKEKKPIDLALFSHLNGYTIKPGESFSLLSFNQENNLSDAELYSYNLAATALYQMLLHTNFEIIERHIGGEIPTYAEIGYEASILPNHWDFIVKNPNPVPYTLKTSYQNDQLHVNLQGAPLPAEYQPYLLGKKELVPKKIVHRNPTLAYGAVVMKVTGKPGYDVQVYRQKLNNGNLVNKELISEDFYPPIHHVQEWGPNRFVEGNTEVSSEQRGLPLEEEEDSSSQHIDGSESDWIILQ